MASVWSSIIQNTEQKLRIGGDSKTLVGRPVGWWWSGGMKCSTVTAAWLRKWCAKCTSAWAVPLLPSACHVAARWWGRASGDRGCSDTASPAVTLPAPARVTEPLMMTAPIWGTAPRGCCSHWVSLWQPSHNFCIAAVFSCGLLVVTQWLWKPQCGSGGACATRQEMMILSKP